MDTERIIALNALTLLVRKNDPTVFDNPDIFEKKMIENGASGGTDELSCLKQSLKLRIPWEVRRGGVTVDSAYANSVAEKFSEKASVSLELAIWAIRGWISAMGLKLNVPEPAKEPEPIADVEDLIKELDVAEPQIQTQSQTANSVVMPKPDAFSNTNGRLGIVFGEDSEGVVKVFNAWYADAEKSETSGLAATPIKLKAEPVVLFKAAPKKTEKKVKKTTKPQNVVPQDKTKYEPNVSATNNKIKEFNDESPAVKPVKEEYKPNSIEIQALELLKKGGSFTYSAIKMLAPIAVGGSAFACRVIGEIYGRGRGVKQDFNAAKAWLDKAIAMGDVEALFIMGNLYQFGMGVEANLKIAKTYYDSAAAKGHNKAMESLKLINGLVSY